MPALVAITGAASASAVESEYLDSVVGLDEVSVSVIKSTSQVMFPSSVSELNMDMIERFDIDGVKGVSEIVPNFYMPQYGSRMTSSIYVRGLGTRIDQPIVALNVDNVPMLNKDSYDFTFADIDRIEVVRGPQSILYGRNSIGGVINMSTLSPLRYQGVRAMAEYGSGNSWRGALSVYGKLSPVLGLSAGGSYYSTDGFSAISTPEKKSTPTAAGTPVPSSRGIRPLHFCLKTAHGCRRHDRAATLTNRLPRAR